MKKPIISVILGVILMLVVLICAFCLSNDADIQKKAIEGAVDTVKDLTTYSMSEEDVKKLPSTEIPEEQNENDTEQEVETESFELQGEIAYEGDKARSWNVTLGDYKGLTYYSQIDTRWRYHPYTVKGDNSQNIGTSGCGPTCAAMVVTACKGAITPDTMGDLFVQHGYRSANSGTYWSAYRAIADEFNIGYTETTDIQQALQLLASKHYVVASVGNGLFTTGGHFILLVGVDNETIKIYDPYLYSGKFNTSTRRGKVTVDGNTVYCSVNNFKKYANYKGFFAYAHDGNVQENNQPVTTAGYTMYVSTSSKNLRVRYSPNGKIVGSLSKGTAVTVYEVSGGWARIGTNQWVSYSYLSSQNGKSSSNGKYKTGKYQVSNVQKGHVLNVRNGPGTNYTKKTYKQLTSNAKSQNKRLGNAYANGYLKGVTFTVSQVKGSWGKTPSGWISLQYCKSM